MEHKFLSAEHAVQVDVLANEILTSVIGVANEPHTAFLGCKGKKYTGQLMIVGRSPNGWDTPPVLPQNLESATERQSYAMQALRQSTDNDPMAWVKECWGKSDADYNPLKSPFWRVTKRVVGGLRIVDQQIDIESCSWASYLVWSNLYKVAPSAGGNPKTAVANAQLAGCKKLLFNEIEIYQPENLLFITGWDWADSFISDVWLDAPISLTDPVIEGLGYVRLGELSIKSIVAKRPEGNNEEYWANSVLQGFQSLQEI